MPPNRPTQKLDPVSSMGSGNLGRELELKAVVEALKVEFQDGFEATFQNPSMVTIRFESNGPAVTLYRTGSFQIRTAGNEDRLFQSRDRLFESLASVGVALESPTFSHLTSVYQYNIGQSVTLENIALSIGLENVEYEPEQFPGLIFRPDGVDTTMLIFGSGKVIVAGAKSEESAEQSIDALSRATDSSPLV